MRKAPLGKAGPKVKQKRYIHSSYSTFVSPPQPALMIDRLRRQQHLRRDLDRWNHGGRCDALPQPVPYGLRLPHLCPAEVIWPEGRP